jgi:hypothetical protein
MALGKGKASHSSSGASMSKYDVEVEARLKKLEAIAHENCGTGGGDADLAERLDIIEAVLRKNPQLSFEKNAAKERAQRG